MSKVKFVKPTLEQRKIDQEVIVRAKDNNAWEKEFLVEPKIKPTSIQLSTRTIERAKFCPDSDKTDPKKTPSPWPTASALANCPILTKITSLMPP